MNNTYRLIWNELANTWVAVAENAKSRGKRSAGALLLTAVASVAMAQTVSTQQLPTGGQIVSGSGAISAQGAAMTVNQNTARMITNWSSFNIGANASVNFVQPSASAVALNRIQSQDPTQIMGRLTANGQVMLVNPAGVVFGRGSQVDVGSLVASSLAISDANFLNGNYRFAANGLNTLGAVVNQGRITTANGGAVAFLAPVVKNEGQITTPKGSTLLAAAQDITVDFAGDGLISYRVNAGAANALVENTGTVMADGGMAVLSAQSVDSVTQGVVNNTGLVRAQRLENRDGRIVLEGQSVTQAGALTANTISAFASGRFEQTATGVMNADGDLAANGGTVRVDAGAEAVLSGHVSANGNAGGNITVAAPEVSVLGATLQAMGQGAQAGNGGTIRIGGGYQGKDADIVNAQRTRVLDSTLDVSAVQNGNAGTAIVWSEQQTIFNSTVNAKGGAQAGNGGLVEVSSHDQLSFSGRVIASAANGTGGRLLLDPKDITIGTTVSGVALGNPLTDFATTASGASNIAASDIATILSGGTALTLQANNDITVNNDIVSTNSGGTGAGHLTLQAGRSILLNANITTANGNVTLVANDPGAVSNRAAGLAHIQMISPALSSSTIDAGTGDINILISAANAASVSVTANPSTSGRGTTDSSMLTNGITLGLLKGKNITVRNDQLTTGANSSRPLGVVAYSALTVEATGNVLLQASNGIITSGQITTNGTGQSAPTVSLLARDDITAGNITNSALNGAIALKAGRSITVNPSATIAATNGGDITLVANNPYDNTTGVALTRETGDANITVNGQINASDMNGKINGNVNISMGAGTGLSNSGSGLITFGTASGVKGKNITVVHGGTGTTTGVKLGGTMQALGLWDTTPSTPTLTTAGAIEIAANNGSVTTQLTNYFFKGSEGSTAFIRARDDITITGTLERNTVSGSGLVGELKMLAGGSVNLNGSVTTNNSSISIKANYSDNTDTVSDSRLAGAAVISMSSSSPASKIDAGTGSIDMRVMDGSGLTTTNASAVTSGAITLKELIGGNITIVNNGTVLGTSSITSSFNNIAATGNVLLQANKGTVTLKGITTNGSSTAGASINVLAMDDIVSATNAIENSAANGNITLLAGRSITSSNHINSTNGGSITIRANNPYDNTTGISSARSSGTAVITITGDVVAANGSYVAGPVDISMANGANLADSTSGTLSLYGVIGKTINVTSSGTSGTGISLNRTLRAYGVYDSVNAITTTPGTTNVSANNGGITALAGAAVGFAGSEGNTVVLRARDDITLNTSFVDRLVSNGSNPAGEMQLLAGRSVLMNSEFQGVGSPLTIKANYFDGTSSVSATRLPGAAAVTMGGSYGAIRNSTNVNISVMDGVGLSTTDSSPITSGNITLKEIPSVVNLTVTNNGLTPGSSVTVGTAGLGITSTVGTPTSRTGPISGLINISTRNGDINLLGNIATSNASAGAITLTAGTATSAPTSTGGDIILTGTRTLTTGAGGSAWLFAGGSGNSTGLSALATSARTFYNVDPANMPSSGVTTGIYAFFRQNTLPLTLTLDNTSMIYGDAYPTLPTFTLTGGSFNAGDSITSIAWGSAATAFKAQGTYAYSTANFLAPTFNCAAAGCASNYSLTFVNDLTITPRPIIITADAKSMAYGGVAPALTYQLTSGNLVNGDTLSGALTRTAGTHAGTYPIAIGTLAASSNYAVTYAPANFVINPAVLTVSMTNTGVTKTYDGTYSAPVGFTPAFSVAGLVSGDTASIFYSAAGFNDPHVLTANKVTASPLSITSISGTNGSLASDYVLGATSAFVPATITPAPVTVSSATIAGTLSKAYDGTAAAPGATVTGLVVGAVAGDTLGLDTSGMSFAYGGIEGASMVRVSGRAQLRVDQSSRGSRVSDYSFTDPVIADVPGEIGKKPAQNSPIPPAPQSNAVNATVDLNVEMKKEKVVAVADVIASAKVATEAPQMKLSATLTFGVADSLGMELVVSSNAASLTTVDSGPAKTGSADDSEVKTNSVALFNQTGDKVSSGGALSIVEQGKNMRASVTTADTAPSLNVNLAGMRFVNVDFKLPSGAPNQLSVGVSADGMLVVKVPPAMKASSDDRSLALIGMATAKERLDVQPSSVKGVVIQVE